MNGLYQIGEAVGDTEAAIKVQLSCAEHILTQVLSVFKMQQQIDHMIPMIEKGLDTLNDRVHCTEQDIGVIKQCIDCDETLISFFLDDQSPCSDLIDLLLTPTIFKCSDCYY